MDYTHRTYILTHTGPSIPHSDLFMTGSSNFKHESIVPKALIPTFTNSAGYDFNKLYHETIS